MWPAIYAGPAAVAHSRLQMLQLGAGAALSLTVLEGKRRVRRAGAA